MAIYRLHWQHTSAACCRLGADRCLAEWPEAGGLGLPESPAGQLHPIAWWVQRQVNMHHLEQGARNARDGREVPPPLWEQGGHARYHGELAASASTLQQSSECDNPAHWPTKDGHRAAETRVLTAAVTHLCRDPAAAAAVKVGHSLPLAE